MAPLLSIITSLETSMEQTPMIHRSMHEHDSLRMDEHCLPELFYDDVVMLPIQLCILEVQ